MKYDIVDIDFGSSRRSAVARLDDNSDIRLGMVVRPQALIGDRFLRVWSHAKEYKNGTRWWLELTDPPGSTARKGASCRISA